MITIIAAAAASMLSIKSSTLEVKLDPNKKGDVASITTPRGVEFASGMRWSLFAIDAYRDDDFTKSAKTESDLAKEFSLKRERGGVTLVWKDLGEAVESATATVVPGNDGEIRWNLKVKPRTGWSLAKTSFPQLKLKTQIGANTNDDAFVFGNAKGGVIRNPRSQESIPMYWTRQYTQPGPLVAQFCAFFDDRALLYFAAEDATGQQKSVRMQKFPDAFNLTWNHCFGAPDANGVVDLKFDYVMKGVDAPDGWYCDWYDAADIYRAWAEKQAWCRVKLTDRKDLPDFMKAAPGMVRFNRDWIDEHEPIRKWAIDLWQREFKGTPLVVAFWGWEKVDYWITPDYFPIHGGDAEFRSLTADLLKVDAHSFPWPSGYHWTITYDKRSDGSFLWDDSKRFYGEPVKHNCRDKKNFPTIHKLSWLRGGDSGNLCGGDKWTRRWWNEDICAPLAERGCEMIQVDQVVGGNFPDCWARDHGHRPGGGEWRAVDFREQLVTMHKTMSRYFEKPIVCYEEPEELWNDLVGIQDYRDCESPEVEWAGVFNYIYHEYVPCFQSNPRRGDRFWESFCCAEGQIPHFVPSRREIESGLLLGNGDFEKLSPDGKAFSAWENPRFMHVDRETKHDGEYALMMENTGTNHQQIAKNISVDDFVTGHTYRVSAWVKSATANRRGGICYAAFAPGLKNIGGAYFPLPDPKDGWKLCKADFKIRSMDGEMFRFMINCDAHTKFWIDSIVISEVMPDGSERVMKSSNGSAYMRFMSNWMKLYHGKGRPYLAHGKRIRPPRVECATIPYRKTRGWTGKQFTWQMPVVRAAAYEAADGSRAFILVNSTAKEQQATVTTRDGRKRTVTLNGDEIRLFNY